MNNSGTFTKLSPLSLLRQLSNCSENTYLQAFSNSVSWSIYLENGKITYATDSVEPFDRLERHLRRLSHQIPLLKSEIRVELRLIFETNSHGKLKQQDESLTKQPPDYQAICWLVSQKYLNSAQAEVLIQELVREVIESFLLIKQGTYNLIDTRYLPKICKLNVEKVIERCQERLQIWQSLAPHISSPFQRPYLCDSKTIQPEKLPQLQPNLTHWMKGFSLRHVAVIINQDELKLAQNLYPYILHGSVLLHQPDPPFDKLPKFVEELSVHSDIAELVDIIAPSSVTPKERPSITENTATRQRLGDISSLRESYQQSTEKNNTNTASLTDRKGYKIVSVDDSPTILKEISRLLENENFSVVTISDPLKAVMSIIRHKPDLILLDLNMAGIDGYELCRIIRNNSIFKNTPIIFVTGNKGIIDKIKARFVGASGYLTKPFTRSELLKMVFMHLS
jgi:two-component system, chemotaxis family, response regulator PixG